jgi:acyl carrier protein
MDVLTKVQALLRDELGLEASQVQPEQRLAEQGIDSLAAIEMMFSLEKAFDVRLPETGDLPETVADLAALVETALGAQAK